MSELLRHRGGSQPTFAPCRITGHMIREGYPPDDGAKRPVPTEEMKKAQSLQPCRAGHGALIVFVLSLFLRIPLSRRTNSTNNRLSSYYTYIFMFTFRFQMFNPIIWRLSNQTRPPKYQYMHIIKWTDTRVKKDILVISHYTHMPLQLLPFYVESRFSFQIAPCYSTACR